MIHAALKWVGGIDGFLELVDQRLLPGELVRLECRSVEQLYEAIKALAVRGAPAIGVAGAYGLVLTLQNFDAESSVGEALEGLRRAADYLDSSRPTAVNLFWALDRVKAKAEEYVCAKAEASLRELRAFVLSEANAICQEDADMCRRIGENGERFIKDGAGILTHCNAGALATAGQGTALSVIFEAHKKGNKYAGVNVDTGKRMLS